MNSLVPPELALWPAPEALDNLDLLDEPLRKSFDAARGSGRKLRFVARLREGSASVGLETLKDTDPLSGGSGTDNRVAIWSDRYQTQPLVIQGPGAGAEVTAAALLDDALRLNAWAGAPSGATRLGCETSDPAPDRSQEAARLSSERLNRVASRADGSGANQSPPARIDTPCKQEAPRVQILTPKFRNCGASTAG